MSQLYALATRTGYMVDMEEITAATNGEVRFFSLIEHKSLPFSVYMIHDAEPTIWIETQLRYKSDMIELITLRAHNSSIWRTIQDTITKKLTPVRLHFVG